MIKTAVRYYSDLVDTQAGYVEHEAMQAEAYDLINYWERNEAVARIRDWDTRMAAGYALHQERLLAMELVCEAHGVVYGDSPKARREAERERRFESRF